MFRQMQSVLKETVRRSRKAREPSYCYLYSYTSLLWSTVELGYNVTKGTERFVSLQTNVVITEEYSIMVNSEELIGNTEYLTP
jgi:hypothetical protein